MRRFLKRILPLAALAPAAAYALPMDSIVVLVNEANAVGSTSPVSLASFTYNPLSDTMYVASFQANGALRRINKVGGAQTVDLAVTQSEWALFYRSDDPNLATATTVQVPNGMLINPKAIGSTPAYSMAVVIDQGPNVTDGPAATPRTDITKRLYAYDLGVATTGSGSDVFRPIVNKQAINLANGSAPDSTTNDNIARQGAWSGDGQSMYFVLTGTGYAGLWKADIATGTPTKLVTTAGISEPGVLTIGGVDHIYFRGQGANAGGVDFVTHNGVTTSAIQTLLTAAERSAFLETTGTGNMALMGDEDGNLFIYDNTSRVLMKRDSGGNLSKVLNFNDRDLTLTGAIGTTGGTGENPNAGVSNMQYRKVIHPTYGFEVTQIMYAEKSSLNLVAGAYVFKAGDFNRDNLVNLGDLDAIAPGESFKTALNLRGVAAATADYAKIARFDMNGNSIVDWKDVKLLQQFLDIPDGDANMDSFVNYGDLDIVGANYLTGGKNWLGGDFASIDPLYAATAADANVVNYIDLELLALNWDLAQPTFADLDRQGYSGAFRTDVIRAFNITQTAAPVPEPASCLLLGLGALAMARRGRREV